MLRGVVDKRNLDVMLKYYSIHPTKDFLFIANVYDFPTKRQKSLIIY